MTILETEGLSMYFGGLKAVDDINMKVEQGQIFGVIGPNGAGKTTFFNVCTGNYTPTKGSVMFDGQNITGLNPEQIAAKGMARTFQNIKLFNNMTVLDNVKIGFNLSMKTSLFDAILHTKKYKEDEKMCNEKGMEVLKKLDLDSLYDSKAGNLSYGTQRKVEIARAIAMNPQIILLDEPAAGMNPSETQQLSLFVSKLRDMGFTIVVIEHDMKFIMSICDRIMVMQYGKKLFEGTPLEVKNSQDVIDAYFGKGMSE